MKIYISHSTKYDYMNKICEPIKESNLVEKNIFLFPHREKGLVNTKETITDCDLLIAEVSLPSTGQGIEIGWASAAKIPVLCVYEKGADISSSLQFITKNFIEYENAEDMIDKISKFISK